jgi:hypothetical protein
MMAMRKGEEREKDAEAGVEEEKGKFITNSRAAKKLWPISAKSGSNYLPFQNTHNNNNRHVISSFTVLT